MKMLKMRWINVEVISLRQRVYDSWCLDFGPLETSAGVAAENNFEKPPPHTKGFVEWSPRNWMLLYTLPKTNKSPLKSYLAPKRDRIVFPTTGFLQGLKCAKKLPGAVVVVLCFFLANCRWECSAEILEVAFVCGIGTGQYWPSGISQGWRAQDSNGKGTVVCPQLFHLIAWQFKKIWSWRSTVVNDTHPTDGFE